MHASAQMPSQDDFEAAVAAARPTAEALGLSLHTEGLWAVMLRARAPMLASVAGKRCSIGYAAYTPGRNFAWLFPSLVSRERQLWLEALVQHELAHCIDPVGGVAAESVAGLAAQRAREAYADLAFALHIDERSEHADALIETLAALRLRMGKLDPEHDTADVLRCYLAHPMRGRDHSTAAGDWPLRLAAWRQRCAAATASAYAGP